MAILKIIKRLELIKNLIYLEEEGEIEEQISKFKRLQLDKELISLIELLEQNAYGKAVIAIEKFINRHNTLSFYIDPEVEGLKLEVKALEKNVYSLSNEKAELEKIIYEFEVRHNHELGETILKILELRKSKAKGTTDEKETEQDFDDFKREFNYFKDEEVFELTEDEKTELKGKYRKASKLCHPDVVSEEQKANANEIFGELSLAYEKNDLKRISQILERLEKGDLFDPKSDSIDEKQILKIEIEKLRSKISDLQVIINTTRASATYKTISSITDWDEYFKNMLQQLLEQLKILQGGRE